MKVEKLPSGNYRVRVVIGHAPDGRPLRKSFTHPDRKTLLAIASTFADEHRLTSRQTVAQALDRFISAKTPVLSPSTIRAYTSLSKTLKSQYAAFCGLYVDSVGQDDMQALINSLVEKGKTPKTVRNITGFLSASFKFAGFRIPEATLPQKQRPNIQIPNEEDAKRIASAACGTRLEIPVALAFMGMRRSEICGLSIADLDGNVVHIHTSAVYGADRRIHAKYTKTYTSDRYVRIPAHIAAKIRAQGYVTDFTPAGLTHAFTRMLQTAGLPSYRLHDLRHFFVSYCHNVLSLSDAQIQAITGHKSTSTMYNYLHSMRDEAAGKTVAESIGSLF